MNRMFDYSLLLSLVLNLLYYQLSAQCSQSSALTVNSVTDATATLAWTSTSGAMAWNIEYGPKGYSQGAGTTVAATTNPFTITGLTEQTEYDFYLQDNCGGGSLSLWAGPVSFKTECSLKFNGTYTIDPSLPASSTNYQDFTSFVSDLNQCGVDGPVVVNVAAGSGPYTEQIVFNEFVGSSATNTVTINGNGNILQYTPSGSDPRATLKFDGADHIILDNLEVHGNNSTVASYAIHLKNSADFITIKNCDIVCTGWSSFGIIGSNSETNEWSTDLNSSCSNLLVENCDIDGGFTGIVMRGGTVNFSLDNTFINNIVHDWQDNGIHIANQKSLLIENNDINKATNTSIRWTTGIAITDCFGASIINNKIHDNSPAGIPNNNSRSFGIRLVNWVNDVGTITVANNMLYNFRGNLPHVAISAEVYYATVNIYHNTIIIDQPETAPTASDIVGIDILSNNNLFNLKNNLIYINSTNTANQAALQLNGKPNSSDYNVLHVASTTANSYGVIEGGTQYATLANWQGSNSNNYDQNSSDEDPFFTNPASADFTPANLSIDNMGTNVGVLTDINGTKRSTTTPDVGAIEFNACSLSGTYTINPSIPASSTNYQDFTSFVVDLNQCGVTGPVTVNVKEGTYNEQIEITEFPGASAINMVTIQSDPSNTVAPIVSPSTYSLGNFTFHLNACTGIKVDGLNVISDYNVIAFTGSNVNIEIANCELEGFNSNSTSPTYSIFNGLVANTRFDDLKINYNNIHFGSDVFRWISPSGSPSDNFEFNNNTLIDYSGDHAIEVAGFDNVIIKNNVIRPKIGGSKYGIDASGSGLAIIEGNDMLLYTDAGETRGIWIGFYSGSPGNPSRIVNNIICMVSSYVGYTTMQGIRLTSSTNVQVYHNTVRIPKNQTGETYGFLHDGWTPSLGIVHVVNNIFSNIDDGGAWAIGILTTNTQLIDYNVYQTNNASKFRMENVIYNDLNAWQSATGFDQNSVDGDPIFVSNTDLHVLGTLANDVGDNTVGITTDIDGDTRPFPGSSTVDIGADEFDPAPNWTGATNSQWAVGTNWYSGTPPVNGDDVIINGGAPNQPVISQNVITNDLRILSGAAVELGGTNTLSVNGNLSITDNEGLVLKSTSASTGYAQLLTNGSIEGAGAVKGEFYVGNNAGYRYVSSPFDTEFNDLKVGSNILVSANTPQGNLFEWDASGANWAAPGLVTDHFNVGQGYNVFMGTNPFGTFVSPLPAILDLSGSLLATGDVPVSLGYINGQSSPVFAPGSPVSQTEGWNLLGNPYTCTYDWDGQTFPAEMTNQGIAIWNPTTGQYAYYNNGTGVNGGSRYIAPYQGIFVQTTAATTFTFEKANRTVS